MVGWLVMSSIFFSRLLTKQYDGNFYQRNSQASICITRKIFTKRTGNINQVVASLSLLVAIAERVVD